MPKKDHTGSVKKTVSKPRPKQKGLTTRKTVTPPPAPPKPRPEKNHPYVKGDRVMVIGEHGTYRVYDEIPFYDNSVLLYGGDKDPRGIQRFRSVMPNRIKLDKRKHTTRKDDDAT